jgi:hypothetical protein
MILIYFKQKDHWNSGTKTLFTVLLCQIIKDARFLPKFLTNTFYSGFTLPPNAKLSTMPLVSEINGSPAEHAQNRPTIRERDDPKENQIEF